MEVRVGFQMALNPAPTRILDLGAANDYHASHDPPPPSATPGNCFATGRRTQGLSTFLRSCCGAAKSVTSGDSGNNLDIDRGACEQSLAIRQNEIELWAEYGKKPRRLQLTEPLSNAARGQEPSSSKKNSGTNKTAPRRSLSRSMYR